MMLPLITHRTALEKAVIGLVLVTTFLVLPASAHAVSSWSPTLLVNTESFQTIDSGDGTTDIELRFGSTTTTIKFLNARQIFQFSKGISVLGTISGSSLAIDGNATISGSLLIKNNIAAKGTVSGSTINGFGLGSCNGASQKIIYNSATGKFECGTDLNTGTTPPPSVNTGGVLQLGDGRYVKKSGDTMTGALNVRSSISGSHLTISGQANLSGALTVKGVATLKSTLGVTGNITTDGNLVINNDADSNDAILTFGNASGNQTLKFLHSLQRFEFSKSLRVLGTISGSALRVDGNATIGGPLTVTGSIKTKGNLSGSTLTVDGNITLHGVTYSAPTTQGSANSFLKNDGTGNLTWGSVGNGSGGVLSLHPEYPNAVYFSSGATYVGQMTLSGGTTALDNSYVWTSSRGTLQDYWISIRVRVPDNFSSWDPVKPIEFRYKTGVASSANNALKVLIRDTAGTYIPLTGGSGLSSTSWATALITGPQSAGTWTPKGYMTIFVKLAADSTAGANAAAGYLNLNYETTTP